MESDTPPAGDRRPIHKQPSVVVIIPALNEVRSVGRVVSELPLDLIREVIVVDNASDDGTDEVARAAGATVLREERGGYGWACMRALHHVQEDPPDIVAFIDADYSDFPSEVRNVLEPILSDEADFVVGSRTIGDRESGALLPQALVGNLFACAVIRLMSGVRFTDLGPLRAIRYADLRQMDMQEMRYGWTVEMQIKAVKAGLRCREVPVSYRRRIGVSKVTGTFSGTVKASSRILRVLARYVFRRA